MATASKKPHRIAHKTRVHLNNKQRSWMVANCVGCRLAYNYAIEQMNRAYQARKYEPDIPHLSPKDIRKMWTVERYKRYPWMENQRLLLSALNNAINVNYAAALNQWKKSHWNVDKIPRYHGRRKSLSVMMDYTAIADKHIDKKTLQLPQKMGTCRLAEPLRFKGTLKQATFSESGGKWYVSFLLAVDELPERTAAATGTSIGVDMGVSKFVTLSNAEHIEMPPQLDEAREHTKKIQRQLSNKQGPVKRKRKASKNWLKLSRKLSAAHRKTANIRRNTMEHVTKSLAEQYETVVIEDLKVKNMTGSAKGDADQPGTNVAAKSGLNREILNNGFYQFRELITHKAAKVIAVDPKYTSQTCSQCGVIDKNSRLSQSEFKCTGCGFEINADVNAAQNILDRALSQ